MGIIVHEYAFDELYAIDADGVGISLIQLWWDFSGAMFNLANERVVFKSSFFSERSLGQTCVFSQFFEVRATFFAKLFCAVFAFCLCRQVFDLRFDNPQILYLNIGIINTFLPPPEIRYAIKSASSLCGFTPIWAHRIY